MSLLIVGCEVTAETLTEIIREEVRPFSSPIRDHMAVFAARPDKVTSRWAHQRQESKSYEQRAKKNKDTRTHTNITIFISYHAIEIKDLQGVVGGGRNFRNEEDTFWGPHSQSMNAHCGEIKTKMKQN